MLEYVPRPHIDSAIAERISRGSGVFTLEGPPGAGKSCALLHGLLAEMERRSRKGRSYVRLIQLYGDEPPSLFARRLLREASHLHLIAYPQPEKLAVLIETMAQMIPDLLPAGKLLAALIPDDLRPLPEIASQALAQVGERAIAIEAGGPLVIGIDVLGTSVADGMRGFMRQLASLLPPTVVVLVAQGVGHGALLTVSEERRIQVGAFTSAEALAYLHGLIGPIDEDGQALVRSGELSLLPGDLAGLINLSAQLGADPGRGLRHVAAQLAMDVAARYKLLFERMSGSSEADPRALDLCAYVHVASRPDRPVTCEQVVRRFGLELAPEYGASTGLPVELLRIRRSTLITATCATVSPSAAVKGEDPDPDIGWPIAPRSAQARTGIRLALSRHGLLSVYRQKHIDELWQMLRRTPGPEGLLAGVHAFSCFLEEPAADPRLLGQAVVLLSEMETMLWRAGWHRTFAELFDALVPHIDAAGLSLRDVAPLLWFRRARARVQGVDWSGCGAAEELQRAISDLAALAGLAEVAVIKARLALGLQVGAGASSEQVALWCRHLPVKARQASGYARILEILFGVVPEGGVELTRQRALDDVLFALSHFTAVPDRENAAQTLTILADWYSICGGERDDALALNHYERAIELASTITPLPTFTLAVIERSLGNHHLRRKRRKEALAAHEKTRRLLLRSPEAQAGTLLSVLLIPDGEVHDP